MSNPRESFGSSNFCARIWRQPVWPPVCWHTGACGAFNFVHSLRIPAVFGIVVSLLGNVCLVALAIVGVCGWHAPSTLHAQDCTTLLVPQATALRCSPHRACQSFLCITNRQRAHSVREQCSHNRYVWKNNLCLPSSVSLQSCCPDGFSGTRAALGSHATHACNSRVQWSTISRAHSLELAARSTGPPPQPAAVSCSRGVPGSEGRVAPDAPPFSTLQISITSHTSKHMHIRVPSQYIAPDKALSQATPLPLQP